MEEAPRPFDIRDRLFEFARDVVNAFPRTGRLDLASLKVWSQLLASASSSGAQMEEAQAGGSRAHFVSLCRGGLREMRESHYWLRLMVATKLTNYQLVGPLVRESNELTAILTAIVRNAVKNAEKNKEERIRNNERR